MDIQKTSSSLNPYIASGKSIMKASDNAAGLSIIEKMKGQASGMNQGSKNAAQGRDMIQTADSALGSISDSLQRIKELSLQASNTAIYNAEDIQAMQDEVGQLLSGIQDVAKGTTYNNQTLLDGSRGDLNLAINPSGGSRTIQMANSTLSSLGIEGYDVTKNFDLSKIDTALTQVSSQRSSLGAQSNSLTSIMDYNSQNAINTTGAQSRIEDLDMGRAISEKEKLNILEQYKITMEKRQEEDKQRNIQNLLNL